MKPIILGFTGKKGHGKTTACLKAVEVLESKGYKIVRINFKDALISTMKHKLSRTLQLISDHYSLSIEELFEQKPPLMRTLMQEFGTEIYRSFDPDYWIMQWYISIHGVSKDNKELMAIITDDVRFSNEELMLKAKMGILIRINRSNYNDDVSTTHQSEIEMDSFKPDHVIIASNREELELNIEKLINQII